MPRAVVYGGRSAADQHYQALVADEPIPPSSERRSQLRAQADLLAKKTAPDAVRLQYLQRAAEEPNALDSITRGGWWTDAAQRAEAGAAPAPGAEALARTTAAAQPSPSDGYLDKLAKYVPAELITLTTLAFAALEPAGSDVWWLVVGGAVANVLYLFGTALQARPTTPMPRVYFYLLSAGALVLWAIAVVPKVGSEAGIIGANAETEKTFVLAVAAFLIPLLDGIITGLTDWFKEKH